jgi:UDP-N-acetyl-2-amino-2-deoxyglucuronate dehydrogenase
VKIQVQAESSHHIFGCMDKIKFAVAGCGHIGKRHAALIAHHPQAELTALIDTKDALTLNVDQYDVPFFSSVNDFLKSDIYTDVVNIATPNGLHAVHAIACLTAGKHVVIEKPMALNTTEAKGIINTAEQYQRQVFVVKQNRYSPPVVWLKHIVDSNVLGRIYSVQLNCFWNRDERYYKKDNWHGTKAVDGGTLFTQFSHFIDIFYWIFGDVKNISARMRSFNHEHLTEFEDSGIVVFEFGDKSFGSLNFSTAVWDKNFESSITVIAENGSVKIGGQYMDAIECCNIKKYVMPQLQPSNMPNDYGSYKGSAANHNYVIQNVIDVLQRKAVIATNAEDGLKVIDIIERMYKAST